MYSLSNSSLSVEIALRGAELMSLRDKSRREWLWQGDAASWGRRAPILFPVIGRYAGDSLRHREKVYSVTTGHGFGPDSVFTVLSLNCSDCVLRLEADAGTRNIFPFEFRLDVTFQIDGSCLRQTATVANLGDEILPASVGFHPGFQWPLPSVPGATRGNHIILFQDDEPSGVRRLANKLTSAETYSSTVVNRQLALSENLFLDGPLIFDRIASRSLWFGIPGNPGVRIEFPDSPHLGLWSVPGAAFLCIEPWQGYACPQGFTGEILDKPGMIHLEPSEHFSRSITIEVDVPYDGT